MSYLDALVLAIVEGLTEFLPVSSTGHMIIASSIMGIEKDPFTKTFTVAIQLGAILSVVVLYWKRFFQSLSFYYKLLVAFIPAAIVGLLFSKQIDLLFERVDLVAIMLIAGGGVFLFIDKVFHETEEHGETQVNYQAAFKIGLFQVLALIPGVSRSAATIIGGISQKLTKQAAAEFSFLLAIPTMLAATGYKLLTYYLEGNVLNNSQVSTLVLGNAVAFIVAFLAVKSFILYLTNHGFKIFGYYRIIVGTTILILYWLGVDLQVL
ncbi:MAG: undecaprenyl-diphosphate phosphatase [Cyclobacteriaceae bacterium]|nr:undecaprenyl-diphosphate phosphatase [Cyclobacteriaceae bacterium]